MGIQFLFLTCLCVTFSLILPAEINGNPNDAYVLNQEMKKFIELQKIISLQDERISELEKRQVGPDVQAAVELEKQIVEIQYARISELEARVFQLESLQTDEEHKPNTSLGCEMLLKPHETSTSLKASFVRKGTLFI